MRLLDFLSTDTDEPVSRRDALDQLKTTGLTIAAASMPLALLGRSKPAPAQSTGDIVDVLNYALTLEYLEDSYYRQGLNASGLSIPNGARTVYEQVSQHEAAHVDVLTSTIEDLGGTPVSFSDSDFDFTAGGSFDPFNDYPTFLLLSQAFEDTGVRAYKGQASKLTGNDLLTAALQIHSVEARHAAEVRRLRVTSQGASLKPWITRAESGGAPQAVYAGEDNQTQAGIEQRSLGDYSVAQVTEAYDEPLTMEAVAGENGIVPPFFA
jgi:rubrerythrin